MYFSINYDGVLHNIQLIDEEIKIIRRIKEVLYDEHQQTNNFDEIRIILDKLTIIERNFIKRKDYLETLIVEFKRLQDRNKDNLNYKIDDGL